MSEHQVQTELQDAHLSSTGQILYNVSDSGRMFGWGDTVGNGVQGWAKGAIFIHTDGTAVDNDLIHINHGDGTTANFVKVKNESPTDSGFESASISLPDDNDVIFGTGSDACIRWSDADASNHSLVIGLGDSNQGLHITDKSAVATDWNISATTHPNIYVHSNTTPATDYLRIGDHDGTEADIDVVGGTSLALKIAGTEYASLRVTGLAVGTYVVAGTEAGTDQLTLQSTGTAPSGTGANVGHLYADYESDDDELFWLSGTGGTATQLTT